MTETVAIIGGGLTGLSAAYYLGKAHPELDIHVYEQSHRFGGKIQTKRVDGYVVEMGPDSYLGRKMAMTDLVNDLGLGDTLVSNATGQAYVYHKNRIHPIPGGSIMGVPTKMGPFVTSSLISWPGKIRAGLDIFKSPYPLDENGDVSIGDFFHYHLGQEMMDKLIEPLLSGIYGGDIYKISLLSTFAHFIEVEQKHGNMVKGMMAAAASHKKAGVTQAAKGPQANMGDVPKAGKDTVKDNQFKKQAGTASTSGMFRQLTGGLMSVVDAVVDQMPSNVQLHVHTPVRAMEYVDGQYHLSVDTERTFDHVVIATPPATYKDWFLQDRAFDGVRNMDQTSCAIAVLAFDRATFDGDLQGSGLLITRQTDTPLTACTNLSQKWPQTTPADKLVLRVFIGKPGNDAVETLDDVALGELAVREIQRIMGFTAKPLWVEVNRLVRCMPQYYVGHRRMVQDLQAHMMHTYPKLHIIGTPVDGIGIPDGVASAKRMVDQWK